MTNKTRMAIEFRSFKQNHCRRYQVGSSGTEFCRYDWDSAAVKICTVADNCPVFKRQPEAYVWQGQDVDVRKLRAKADWFDERKAC